MLQHQALLAALVFVAATGLTAGGCAAGSEVGGDCASGADCESGACRDGICVDPEQTSSSGPGGSGSGGAGASSTTTSTSSGGGSGVCSPNADGVLERSELPLGPGLSASYRATSDVTVSTAGTSMNGKRTWDLSGQLTGDHTIVIETFPLTGAWYAGTFAGASYSSRLAESSDLLGVFALGESDLSLLGVVSPAEGVSRTELSYDTPIPTLKFPLSKTTNWSASATVTGLASGIGAAYVEDYEFAVDAEGTMLTPFGSFEVQRLRVDLTRWFGAVPTTQRSFIFLAECFGPVATIVSKSNETLVEFTNAAEVRRLTP